MIGRVLEASKNRVGPAELMLLEKSLSSLPDDFEATGRTPVHNACLGLKIPEEVRNIDVFVTSWLPAQFVAEQI